MFKNREVKIHLLIALVFTAICCGAAAYAGMNGAGAAAAAGGGLILLWCAENALRYRKMQRMIDEIDGILHGCDNIRLSDYSEGELSLLRNEVSKMTIMLRSQAEQLKGDKLALADSLADISHQIRTPLTSLNLLLAALKNEELEPEKRREALFEMGRQLDRIDRLVVSLLKIAKIDAGTIVLGKERVPLERLVHNALQPLEIMLELKDIKVLQRVEGEYLGDLAWSEEAVGNILKNCMEHTGEGGRIVITGQENAIYTELVIEDNGSGIAPEDLPHIFDRFYKGRNSGSSSYGIGLALAQMIITGQNGTIKAENGKDGGACFTVRFYKGII